MFSLSDVLLITVIARDGIYLHLVAVNLYLTVIFISSHFSFDYFTSSSKLIQLFKFTVSAETS